MFMFVYFGLLRKNKQYFLKNLSMIVDHYSSIYRNHMILADFNMEPNSFTLTSYTQSLNVLNQVKQMFQRECYLYRFISCKEKKLL